MKPEAEHPEPSGRQTPEQLAELLIRLYDERFGGAASGKFRISRKYLRKLAGRRKLPSRYLRQLADEIFELGYVFVDCESYSIVLNQKQFASYRRVTDVAANKVLSHENARSNTKSRPYRADAQPDYAEIEKSFVQKGPEIH